MYAIGDASAPKTRHLPQIRCRDPKFEPGYVALNHRPRRNARTYTPPGSGGTFLRKVPRWKARSLFRKTSSNVPRRRGVPPPPLLAAAPLLLGTPVSSFCRELRLDKRGTPDGILMKSHAVYELARWRPNYRLE